MKTVGALKAIYTALGGDADDVANLTTIPAILTAISAVIPAAIAPPESNNGEGSDT